MKLWGLRFVEVSFVCLIFCKSHARLEVFMFISIIVIELLRLHAIKTNLPWNLRKNCTPEFCPFAFASIIH